MADRRRAIAALDATVELSIDGSLGVPPDLFEAIRTDAGPGAVTASFALVDDGEWTTLQRDGERLGTGRTRTMLQLLLTHLGRLAMESTTPVLHATTLRRGDGCVALVGSSGAGKSTLSAALLRAGWRLVAEDITALDHAGLPRCYQRPVGLSERSLDLIGVDPPAWAGGRCGCGKVPMGPGDLGHTLAGPAPIRAVVAVDHRSPTFEKQHPARLLQSMLERGAAATGDGIDGLEVVAGVLASAACAELGSADLAVAADLVGQLTERQPPAQPWLVERRGELTEAFIGDEAVVIGGGSSHHLNAAAAAIWLLHGDGLDPTAIAEALSLDRAAVHRVLDAVG